MRRIGHLFGFLALVLASGVGSSAYAQGSIAGPDRPPAPGKVWTQVVPGAWHYLEVAGNYRHELWFFRGLGGNQWGLQHVFAPELKQSQERLAKEPASKDAQEEETLQRKVYASQAALVNYLAQLERAGGIVYPTAHDPCTRYVWADGRIDPGKAVANAAAETCDSRWVTVQTRVTGDGRTLSKDVISVPTSASANLILNATTNCTAYAYANSFYAGTGQTGSGSSSTCRL